MTETKVAELKDLFEELLGLEWVVCCEWFVVL